MGTRAHVTHRSPTEADASSFFKGHESNDYSRRNCNLSTSHFSVGVINERPATQPTALTSKVQTQEFSSQLMFNSCWVWMMQLRNLYEESSPGL